MTLEEAIRVADECVQGGEGVRLLYYMEPAAGYEPRVADALKILREVLE